MLCKQSLLTTRLSCPIEARRSFGKPPAPRQAASADDWRDAKELEKVRMPGRGYHEARVASVERGGRGRGLAPEARHRNLFYNGVIFCKVRCKYGPFCYY